MSEIETPVRYDPKQQCIRHGEFGTVLVELPQSLTFSREHEEEHGRRYDEQGQHIALCINEYPRLQADLAAKDEKLAKYRDALARSVNLNDEVALEHKIPDSPNYNNCDTAPCQFCKWTEELRAVLADADKE